jgi:hypothetical protein
LRLVTRRFIGSLEFKLHVLIIVDSFHVFYKHRLNDLRYH